MKHSKHVHQHLNHSESVSKTNKQKILVLSDLKESTKKTLKNGVALARLLDADLDFFYVRKPTEIVTSENQLSAIRTINKEQINTERKVKNLLKSFSDEYNININSSFAFGNIKTKIKDHIKKTNPDVVVLGKKKSSPLKFGGDKITDYILSNFSGSVLIAPFDKILEANEQLSLGVLNTDIKTLEDNFSNLLGKQSKTTPLKSFKFSDAKKSESKHDNVIEYVFEKNDRSIKSLSNYLMKNSIDLLFVDRYNNHKETPWYNRGSAINDLINKVEIPMLLSKDNRTSLS